MATAKKLKSGNYRVRIYVKEDVNKGYYKSFTAPTKKEAEFQASKFLLDEKTDNKLIITLKKAMEGYIEVKQGILSPTTLDNYERLIGHFPEALLNKNIGMITKDEIDNFIKEYSSNHSPKSTSNIYGFMHTVCAYNGVELGKHQLPKKVAPTYDIPTSKNIKKLLDTCKDKELRLVVLLGAYCGLRRGEICGLRGSDLDGNRLHIHNNRVISKGGTTDKAPKTFTSDRYITVPQSVVDAIKEMKTNDYLVQSTPNALSRCYARLAKSCGLKSTKLHYLRHFCCSYLHSNSIPDVYLMEHLGWSNPTIMQNVYRNAMSDYSKKYDDQMSKAFDKIGEV